MTAFETLMETKAYRRQIKRRVQGVLHHFAAVVPKALRTLCRVELQALGFSETELSEAGVEFTGNLTDGYLANLHLRTASRILCRVHEFRAGAVEELHSRVSRFPWELWINHAVPLRTQCYVTHSRIRHEALVKKALVGGIQARFTSLAVPPPREERPETDNPGEGGEVANLKQRVLVHIRENRCRISLDTTGAHLHERGYRLRHAGAPLRETLAAAILLKCSWSGSTPLVDGMTGSGTIAIEAALISGRHAPGLRRSFLFQRWPSFKREAWNHLCRRAMAQARERVPSPILALDRSPECLATARENARRVGLGESIRWVHGDFLCWTPAADGVQPGLVVLNPPYGKRLGHWDRGLFESIGRHLRRHYEGWSAAVLTPDERLATALGLQGAKIWRIRHGGLPVLVMLAHL
ncbi:MAG: hypothetical protein GX443_02685 [Deltaproteobacteria bacterium]|nr:hypothetical protein [Deltaproteobacteria bacterium]